MKTLRAVVVLLFAVLPACGDSSSPVVEITDTSIVGRTLEDLQREHGKPSYDEVFTMQEAGGEFYVPLLNYFDRSSDVELRELRWDEGKRYFAIWLQKKDDVWIAFHGTRWRKDVMF